MKAPKNFLKLIFFGVLDLFVGLAVSLYIGITQSWLLGFVLALGFFVSANVLFYAAYRKLG